MKIKRFLIYIALLISFFIGVNIWATTYIDDNHVTADKITTTTTGILTGTSGTIGVTAIPLSVANGGTNSTTAGTYLDATSSIQDQLDGKQPTISVLAVVNGGTGSTTSGTYLDATSAIQAQIDSKSASTHTQETSRGGTAIDLSSSTGILNVNSGTVAVVTPATSGDLNTIAGVRSQTQKKYLEIDSDGLVKATSESSATFKLMGAVETVANGGTGSTTSGTYLDATSSIQTQLDGKQPTITVLTVANGGTGSTTSGTYLDATSAIQAQIDSKSASTHTQETSRGGTAQDFSGSTGVPLVTSGVWSTVTKANSLGLSDIGTAPLWNVHLGDNSLTQITTGEKNVAIGEGSLKVNTRGFWNTAIGFESLVANDVGWQNTAIGYHALESNVGNGYNNTAVGVDACESNVSGNHNVGIGQSALIANITGNNNTAVGLASIYNSQTSTQNVAVGKSALASATDGQEGVSYPVATPSFQYNTTVGTESLFYLKDSAANNTALGYRAGYLNGFAAGTSGSGNLFLGYQAGYNETGSNKLYIDNSNTTSPLIYGDFDTNAVTINGSLITSGTLGGLLTTTTTNDTTYTATTAVCSGGIIHMTAGGTVALPVASVGMSVMTKSTTTDIMHVDPNGTDVVVLDGTALTAGNGVKSPGNAAGEYITFYCIVANKWETIGNPKLFVDNGG